MHPIDSYDCSDFKSAYSREPSFGRIVGYNHPGSADGKFPPIQSPAIIQKVHKDNAVDIVVFSNTNGIFFNKNVKQGSNGGEWSWLD